MSQTDQSCPVPLLDLHAGFFPLSGEIHQAIDDVLDTQRFIMGPHVERLEQALAAYVGCSFAFGVSSGTDALLAALMALDVGAGDEIITSTFTFFATAGAIARVGARPVFADIEPGTFNLDPQGLERVVSGRTRGIVPVHLFGQMADMGPILEFAREHELWVVEDAAQAIGAEWAGHRAGSLGRVGCFSFFPSKNLGCLGDGGAVTTQDADLAATLDILRNHGARPKYHHSLVGGNFRLDAMQAAVLLVKLPHLDGWTAGRRVNAARFRRLFVDAGLAHDAGGVEGGALTLEEAPVILPPEAPQCSHVYNQFVVRARDRDALRAHLQSRQIGCEVYYPVPLHLQECFSHLGYRPGDFPEAELAAQQVLAIPVFPELSAAQAERVVAVFADFYGRG